MIAKVVVLVLLASLVLIAGMFLLAKSKKDNLGKMFHVVSWGTISLSITVIVFAIVGASLMCCFHHNKGKGGKCDSKKECKMKCDDDDACSMNDRGGKCSKGGSCDMSGGKCMMGGKGGDCSMMGGKGGSCCSMMGGYSGGSCSGHSGATSVHEIMIEQKVDDAPANAKETKKTVEIKVDGK